MFLNIIFQLKIKMFTFMFKNFFDRCRGAKGSELMQIFNQPFSFSKLLAVVLRLVSVEELVSVEDAPYARFALYGV